MNALRCFKLTYVEGNAEQFLYAVAWNVDEEQARYAFLNAMTFWHRYPTIVSVEVDYEIKKGMVWIW